MTPERNGYAAIQLGFDEAKPSRVSKPEAGHFARAKTPPMRFVREIRLSPEEAAKFHVGQLVSVGEVFQPGDLLDATGVSKGKGFQGVMKRYHYKGFRATHGTHEYFRHGGSIGCRLTPGRVYKGTKMPGQMGNKTSTVQNIRVVEVLEDKHLILVAGGVPGATEGYVVLRQATKRAGRPFTAKPAPAAEPAPEPAPEQA